MWSFSLTSPKGIIIDTVAEEEETYEYTITMSDAMAVFSHVFPKNIFFVKTTYETWEGKKTGYMPYGKSLAMVLAALIHGSYSKLMVEDGDLVFYNMHHDGTNKTIIRSGKLPKSSYRSEEVFNCSSKIGDKIMEIAANLVDDFTTGGIKGVEV